MGIERFKAWLETSNAHDFLDNAYTGELTMNEVMEVTGDFDIDWTPENVRLVSVAIKDAIFKNYEG